MPPVDSFWSVALYGSDLDLVANALDRSSIVDRTAGLEKDAHGGLTIYLQAGSPGPGKDANWLPCPNEDEWLVVLRM